MTELTACTLRLLSLYGIFTHHELSSPYLKEEAAPFGFTNSFLKSCDKSAKLPSPLAGSSFLAKLIGCDGEGLSGLGEGLSGLGEGVTLLLPVTVTTQAAENSPSIVVTTITVAPAEIAVTFPELSTLATESLPLLHITLFSVASAGSMAAVRVRVSPAFKLRWSLDNVTLVTGTIEGLGVGTAVGEGTGVALGLGVGVAGLPETITVHNAMNPPSAVVT